MSTIIRSIDPMSPAQSAGVQVGEQLLEISGHPVADVLDYRFFGYDPDPVLKLKRPDGTCRSVRVEKNEGLDLGLNFDTYLMDRAPLVRQSLHLLLCGSGAQGHEKNTLF